MKSIDKEIKQYEPMTHYLLKLHKIKKDYEDMLQLLRIKTWEVLRDEKYDKLHKNDDGEFSNAKKSSWLYKVLSDKLKDILKVDYGVKIKDDKKEIEDLPIEKRINYYLMNPILKGTPTFSIENYNSEEAIRCKLDFELYYNQVSKNNKNLIDTMKNCCGNKKEAALKLRLTLRHINRKLKILRNDYKKYLIEGGL